MYQILIDGVLLYDAVDDSQSVSEASITQDINAAAYLDLTVSGTSPVAISEGSSVAEVLWEGKTLFHGLVTDVTEDTYGQLKVSAVSDIDRLNDVLVRPNSTDGSVGEQSPSTLGAYFNWLIEQYNSGNVGGFRIDVGVNQGDQLRTTPISVETTDYPSVASCIDSNVLSNDGYLYYTPFSGGGTLDLYADLHEASDQLIEVGENVVSIEVTRTDDSVVTALVPYATVDGEELTISGASEAEIQMLSNAGFSVNGDAFYSDEQVARYGYREARVEFDGATSVTELIQLAVPYLRTVMSPSVTVSVKAVDMALYKEGYDHLKVGQAVHVRSALHGIDEYMAVQDMDLDLEDPSQTSYTLGVSYDTLTGQQSAFLSKLNGSINGALDKVTGLEDTINKVVNDSNVEYYVSTSPDEPTGGEWGVAVVTPTDNKYIFSHTKNELVDGTIVTSDPTLVTPSITRSLQLHRDFGTDGYTWVNFIAANYDVTDDAAGVCRIVGQMGGWDADKQGAVTVAFGFQDSAYSTGSGSMAGVGVVSEKSSDIDLDATDILSFVDNGRVSVFVRCKGQVTVNLYAEGEGFSTPFVEQATQPGGTQVFDLADVQTTYDSAILQADNAIRAYVAATYATQDALGEVQSTFDLRANQIEASVEEKMDTSVANSTFVDKSTYNQFSDSITQTVESVQQTAEDAQQTADSMSILVDTGEASVAQAGENAGMVPYEVDVYGATRQNLWVNPSGKFNGVTVTDNSDGSLTLSGTSAGYAIVDVDSFALRKGGTYTIAMDNTPPAGAQFRVRLYDGDTWVTDVVSGVTTAAKTFTLPDNKTYDRVRFAVVAPVGTAVSGTYRVMLNEGDTAKQWCPPGIRGVYPSSISVSSTNLFSLVTGYSFDILATSSTVTNPGGKGRVVRVNDSSNFIPADDDLTLYLNYSSPDGGSQQVQFYYVDEYGDEHYFGSVASGSRIKVSRGVAIKSSFIYVQNVDGKTYHVDAAMLSIGDADFSPHVGSSANLDMQGHALYSLTSGARDVLTADSSGALKIEQSIGDIASYDGEDVGTEWMASALNSDGTPATGAHVIYKLSEPQTVNLGTIDLPSLPASSANVWAVSDIPSNVRMLYYGTNAKALSSYATKAELKITSDSITSTVTEVSQTADEALTKASTVEQTVDGVQVTLTSTTQTANAAKTAAQNAQSTANSAASSASTAQSAAETAQAAADAAQSAANTAQQTATDAKKVATNYLKFDSSGLCIGNQTSGTLGYNALITSSQYQIRNGSTVLSSFGASEVNLGQNSTGSIIRMCGGRGYIRSQASGQLQMVGGSSSTWVGVSSSIDIYSNSAGNGLASEITLGGGTTNVLGDTGVKIGNLKSTTLYGVYCGTTIVNPNGNSWIDLFSPSQQASMFGRAFNVEKGDVFLAMNGDTNAQNIGIDSTYFNGANVIGVSFNSSVWGNYRIQWLCVMGS